MVCFFLFGIYYSELMKLFKLAIIALLFSLSAHSEPIEFLVGASPGGPDDTVSRKIAASIESNSDLKFVIINKPGAAHQIAYNYLEQTKKKTVMVGLDELQKQPVYQELETLFYLGDTSNYLFVASNTNIFNLKDFIELSKKRTINFGHGGQGTYSYDMMNELCNSKLTCLPVPYKSGVEGMAEVMNNTIDTYAIVSYGSQGYLQNDKFRMIANIKHPKGVNWVKLFGKNLTDNDKEVIERVMKNLDKKFFTDLGFWN